MTLVGKKVNVKFGDLSVDLTVDAVTTVIMTKASDSTEQLANEIQKPFPSSPAE